MESMRVARQRVYMFDCMNAKVAGALIPTTALKTVHTGNRVENAELNFLNADFSTGAGVGAGVAASADARVTTVARRAVTAFVFTMIARSAPLMAPRAMPTTEGATIVRRPLLARLLEDKGTREAWDVRLGTDAPAPTIAAGAVHAAIMDIERYGRSAARDEGLYAPLKRYDVW